MPESAGASDDAPGTSSHNRVFVTGAGLTRALVPNAPLLVDDFGNDDLADRVIGLLLKLHGSINWRAKLGHAEPAPLDAITHHDAWSGIGSANFSQVDHRLELEPIIVPPVLSKSGLVQQPILRLVWSRAFAILQSAHEVTFIGYSFPATDIAARSLFSEALKDLPRENIGVVNLAQDESDESTTRTTYRSALGWIPPSRSSSLAALAIGYATCQPNWRIATFE